jgi:hypothetical protein
MPLPWKRKYGIKYISQPFFTQQLGVFSKKNLVTKDIDQFIRSIPTCFLKIALQFNSENQFLNDKTTVKNNFILDLNQNYIDLYKQFSKGRKHAIQQGLRNELTIEEIECKELLILAKANYSFKGVSEKEYQKLDALIALTQKKEKVKVLGVKSEKKLIGGAVFLLDANRIIYLFSAISLKGKEMQVGSLLLNSIIEGNSNTTKIVDFEGSMSPSIASFFKSFGAKAVQYSLLSIYRFPFFSVSS